MPSSATFNPAIPKTPSYPRLPLKDGSQPNQLAPKASQGRSGTATGQPLRRAKSSINVRRDPSFVSQLQAGGHSRTNSQASLISSTQPSSTTHTRTNSDATNSSPSQSQSTQLNSDPDDTTIPPYAESLGTLTRSYSVTISTKDGHLLEFDPLQTSPRALDALEGITASAKKQARQEMGRLVQAAVEKWKIV